jgi:hypothetical protein
LSWTLTCLVFSVDFDCWATCLAEAFFVGCFVWLGIFWGGFAIFCLLYD